MNQAVPILLSLFLLLSLPYSPFIVVSPLSSLICLFSLSTSPFSSNSPHHPLNSLCHSYHPAHNPPLPPRSSSSLQLRMKDNVEVQYYFYHLVDHGEFRPQLFADTEYMEDPGEKSNDIDAEHHPGSVQEF